MFVALDLETTGISPDKDKIIEFGAVIFDLEGPKNTLEFLINPEMEIPVMSTHITGISNKDVKNAPTIEEKLPEIKEFIQNFPIVGHNIKFDTEFLRANQLEFDNLEYDTFELASILLPQSPSHSLETLSEILKIEHNNKHRALDDAKASMELFLKLSQEFQSLPPETIKKIQVLSQKSDWPLKKHLNTLKPAKNSKISEISQKTAQKNPKNTPEIAKKIKISKKNTLFELIRPYKQLSIELATLEHPDSYISVSKSLFNEISSELPSNIAQLDLPTNYFSQKRLTEFEKRDHFQNNELTALIKFLIWSQKTETGLISEVNLIKNEKQIIPYINADPTQTNVESEPFLKKAISKDQKNAAVCTHQYLTELKTIEKLILIGFDRYTNNLHFYQSQLLNIDIFTAPLKELQTLYPENKSIDSLKAKTEILFGLIGIIFEKYNDHNPYKARLIVSNLELASTEWENIKKSINNIFEISKELVEISGEKSQLLLQNWKEQLKILIEIFQNPDIENHTIIFEDDPYNNIYIKKIPKNIKHQVEELTEKCQSYQLINQSFDLLDNGQFYKKQYGLDMDLPIEKINQELSPKNITIIKDIPENEEAAKEPFLNSVTELIKQKKGKIAILFNSLKQLELNTLLLKEEITDPEINVLSKLTGSIGKITTKFLENPQNSVLLLTTRTWHRLCKGDCINHIDTLAIQKIPFDPPSDAYLTAISENYQNPFFELQIPRATISLFKIINSLTGPEQKEVIIFDSRLINKQYAKFIKDNLSTINQIDILEFKKFIANCQAQ